MTSQHVEIPSAQRPGPTPLEKQLDGIGWGLLLVITGAVWLAPDWQTGESAWLIATGVLLLALNAVRRRMHVAVSGLTTFLGALALVAGLGDVLGIELPLLAIGFIVIGGSIALKAFIARST